MKILIPISIYLILPLIGLLIYGVICLNLLLKKIPKPPVLSLFILFVHYGCYLQIILTALFWEWSGMVSLTGFYLLFLSPILTLIISINLYLKRNLSKSHKVVYFASLGYLILISVAWVIAIITYFYSNYAD